MTGTAAVAEPDPTPARRRRLTAEIWIVLGLSLGRSGVYAVVNILDRLTRGPLGEQTAEINTSQADRSLLDLTYQVLSIGFALVPVALALYLLSEGGRSAVRRIGLDGSRPGKDALWGLALGAAIGIPGLAIYLAGRALGVTVAVSASGLDDYWWTVPVLILAALKNGLIEEVIVVGYLVERLQELRWRVAVIVMTSSLIRGSYHLYQGWGPFAANIAMGVVFTCFYLSRWGRRRVMPLVVAHTLLDVVAFVGYAYLPASWLDALGIT
ncbi:CPBP family intramembrane glutamic endopeptidase [Pseudactinotalea suaedae]|uniref:CPBP family intramembrane glutamic endopeptidase n=1 Tax=Pseudactinotalea suaedae TaxID=1524924 RepID=UPI0012E1EA0F|nr:CPBP family intramembrane glutamic endopeptidase [Pseudactinotalea suaedae]